MIINNFYNKTLIIATAIKKTPEIVKIDDNSTVLVVDEQVVGINAVVKNDYSQALVNKKLIDSIYLRYFVTNQFENPFVYGYINSIVQHPKSTKLKICQVDIKNQNLQIVCGANNCLSNKYVVVAKIGAILPSTKIIEESEILGIKSSGMLCSKKELGYTGNQSGIIISDEIKPLGESYI